MLRLHGTVRLGPAGLTVLRHLTTLTALVLDGCKGITAAEALCDVGLLPPGLVVLALRAMPCGDAYAGCVAPTPSRPQLTRLELSGLTGCQAAQLRRLLGCCPRLSELNLTGSTELGEAAGLRHLVASCPSLTVLSLAGTRAGAGAGGVEHLAQLHLLRTLSMRGCTGVTDGTLLSFLGCSALQELDLAECPGITERGLAALLAASPPSLVCLDVSGCRGATRSALVGAPHHLRLRHTVVS